MTHAGIESPSARKVDGGTTGSPTTPTASGSVPSTGTPTEAGRISRRQLKSQSPNASKGPVLSPISPGALHGDGWRALAACRGMDADLFHPNDDDRSLRRGGKVHVDPRAVNACASCPVAADCLDEGLREELGGYRAGTTTPERRVMQRRLGIRPEAHDRKEPARCGTEGAYARHWRRGEPICAMCAEAHREGNARRRAQRVSA
jgi:hypothetical protein